MTANARLGLFAFMASAFAISWACWIPAALAEQGFAASWVRWLTYAGALGPAVSGIALTYRTGGQHIRHEYWTRVMDFSRIRRVWLIPILLLYPLVTLLALLVDLAVTGIGPDVGLVSRLLSDPRAMAVFPIWVLLLGPLPEELGWRGYALEQAQRQWNPLMSSIVLGLAWAAWHLPLFFIHGSYQFALGIGSPSFWSYCATIVEASLLLTWIYNNNRSSILAAILFHFSVNFTGAMAKGSPVAEVARAVLLGIAVCLVAWAFGAPGVLRPRERT